MALDDGLFDDSEDAAEFVPAVLARSVEEAQRYRELLDDHDIPAILGTDDELADMEDEDQRLARLAGITHGVPVLVPESLLDEANEIISDRETFEGFEDDADEFDDDEDDEIALTPEEDLDLEDDALDLDDAGSGETPFGGADDDEDEEI